MRHDGKYNALIKQAIITTNSLSKILSFFSKLFHPTSSGKYSEILKLGIKKLKINCVSNFLEQIKLGKTTSTS